MQKFRESIYMNLLSANRQLFNPTTIKHRNYDGHIATAKLCGTHWIKYMLSHVLAQIHDLPPPEHTRDDKIVGHPKNPPVYENIPRLAVTHSHPHYALRVPEIHRALDLPKFVVLVRDPRAILVSIYEKSKGPHIDKKRGKKNVTFSDYLRGDITGKIRMEDLWGLIRFFNAWGAVKAACPERVMMLRYEDLQADTPAGLMRVCNFLEIKGTTPDIITNAVNLSSKDKMRKKLDTSETQYERSVNLGTRDHNQWYGPEDNAFYYDVCRRYLKYDFGYLKNAPQDQSGA